ncbi:hypothetical protein BH11MYX3_BH11MYX3_03140 [soil metagenome]
MKRRARSQAGFTLVELMVSLVMFSLAVGGILAVAVSLTSGYRQQRQAIASEGAVRVPMDYLADAIRQASAGAPGGINLTDVSGTTCTSGAVSVTNGANAPDRLDVIFASGAVVTSTRTILTSSGGSVTVTNTSQLAPNDYVIISDISQGHMFKVTGVNAATGVITLGTMCGTLNWPAADYPAGSMVIRAQHAEFYVGTVDTIPTLMMDPDGPQGPLAAEPLAEGVEDMQVALGIDTNGDSALTDVGAAANDDEWIYNKSGDTLPAGGAIRAVRITLIARASAVVTGPSTYLRPAAEDRVAGSLDAYRRRVLRSTVEVRNTGGSP